MAAGVAEARELLWLGLPCGRLGSRAGGDCLEEVGWRRLARGNS